MAGVSVGTLAELLLIDPRRVQQLSKEGIFPKAERGRYDSVKCVHQYIRFLREQAKGRDPEKVKEEKALVAENRKLKELARKKQEGILVDAEDLRRELAKLFTDVKTRVRGIAPKCAQEVAHMKGSKGGRELITAIEALLKKEHDGALEELSKWKP